MAGLNLVTARIVHCSTVSLDWPYSGCALTERWILTISWLTPSRSVGSTSARPAIASARNRPLCARSSRHVKSALRSCSSGLAYDFEPIVWRPQGMITSQ
jgi:hypothetical protein